MVLQALKSRPAPSSDLARLAHHAEERHLEDAVLELGACARRATRRRKARIDKPLNNSLER